jgi:uncharacterized protein
VNPQVEPRFLELQRRFAAHIRDPAGTPVPGEVSPSRMAVYVDLFFRNLEQLLGSAFPVIRKILADRDWQQLVRAFMSRHQSRTPLFPEIGVEFVEFLTTEQGARHGPPFLAELAHYERLELEVSLAEDDVGAAVRVPDDLMNQPLRRAQSARMARYQFPVHRIGPDFQPDVAPDTPTFLLVYRDREDRVQFLELNAMSYALLTLLELTPGTTARAALRALASSVGHADEPALERDGRRMLQELCERGVLVAPEPTAAAGR